MNAIPLEDQLQHERMERAKAALRRGEMQVTALSDFAWSVSSRDNRYQVALEDAAWRCTCPDFAGRCQQFGLRCKHIEAVRLIEATQAVAGLHQHNMHTAFEPQFTEEPMNQSTPDPSAGTILQRLRQPLDMNRVKRRQAPGLGTAPYLEGFDVIEAANELFQFGWSFDLLSEPHIMRWERAVTHYDARARKKVPLLDADGRPVTEAAGIVYLTGKVTVTLGEQSYDHADAGRRRQLALNRP